MSFDKSVLVPLDADATFALLTEPDRLRRWQAVTARVDLRAGGDYRWTIVPGHTASGTFTEVEPGKRVVFTWGWEGSAELPPAASTVSITLEPSEGGTTVRLVHEGLTPEQEASHAEGWTHYLERLTLAGAHGDAGPDRWTADAATLDELTAAEATLAVCQQVLRGIGPADEHRPTACQEFDVSQLTEHLIGSVQALGGAAGASFGEPAGSTLESRVAAAAQSALEAWRARGIEGTVQLGPNSMPATLALGILSVEFLVHGWDYAQAVGAPFAVSDQLTEFVQGLATKLISPDVRAGGSFAAERPTGPDADALQRLIAFTGRAA